MERRRLTLDSPNFKGNLRYEHRGSSYARRGLQQTTVDEMMFVRNLKPSTKAVAKPAPKHAGVTATKFHDTRTKTQTVSALRPRKTIRKSSQPNRPSLKSLAKPGLSKQHVMLYAMAMMVFVIGVVVSLNGFRANRQVAAQVKQQQHTDSAADSSTSTAPSTVKPSTNSIANYAVAPNVPKYIDITKLGVHARILSMGVNSKNQLQAPGNIYDTGWYNASAQPGQAGAMLLDGHISSWTSHGVFYGLKDLVAGDKLTVTRGDNTAFTYTVVKTQKFDASSVDMASLLVSQDTAKPGLNLISCSGDVIPGTNEFNKRIVVYAVLQ